MPKGKDIEYKMAVNVLNKNIAAEGISELLDVSDIYTHVYSSVYWVCLYLLLLYSGK